MLSELFLCDAFRRFFPTKALSFITPDGIGVQVKRDRTGPARLWQMTIERNGEILSVLQDEDPKRLVARGEAALRLGWN